MDIEKIKSKLFANEDSCEQVKFIDSNGRHYSFIRAWTLMRIESWELWNLNIPSGSDNARNSRTKYYIDKDKFTKAIERILKK